MLNSKHECEIMAAEKIVRRAKSDAEAAAVERKARYFDQLRRAKVNRERKVKR